MDIEKKMILVLGGHRQSLAVMRSVRDTGYRVCLGHDEPVASFCEASRLVDEVWRCPPGALDRPSLFLPALLDLLARRRDIDCIFPVGTRDITQLLPLASALPDRIRLIATRDELWSLCLDKSRMAKIVKTLEIPSLPLCSVLGREAVIGAVETEGWPCIVKPASEQNSICGEKALILQTREDLANLIASGEPDQTPLLVQRYFRGQRHNLYFLADRGRLVGVHETRVDRTDRVDGTGLGVAGSGVEISPEWVSHLERLVAHLEYHGMGCLQFLKSNQTGEGCFLEINARLGANYGHLQKSGVDLLERWIEQVSPEEQWSRVRPQNVRFLRYAWTYGELRSIERRVLNGSAGFRETAGALGEMIGSAWAADVHLDASWQDSRPAWILYSRYGASLFKRLFRKAWAALKHSAPFKETRVAPSR
ncbi:MAG: hypothetical protein P8M78_13575 [Myxococcota bacterium]|nr:hypothetical protein [Myxococcota bacterium]